MSNQERINAVEVELQQIQDELARRHERVDHDDRREHNEDKIDELHRRKDELLARLADLKS